MNGVRWSRKCSANGEELCTLQRLSDQDHFLAAPQAVSEMQWGPFSGGAGAGRAGPAPRLCWDKLLALETSGVEM